MIIINNRLIFMELKNMLDAMTMYNLDANEYLFLYLLFLAQIDENDGLGRSNLLFLWCQNDSNVKKINDLIESLKGKNIIKKDFVYVQGETDPSSIPINKSIVKSLFKHSPEMGEELWNIYPDNTTINGITYSWKNICGKGSTFNSLDDFFYFYGKQINHNPILHKEIIDLINWAKEYKQIRFSIREFVVSHKWEELKRIKESGSNIDEIAETSFIDG